MPDDREAMRLVPDALNQVQARMLRRERADPPFGLDDQLFLSGPALGSLGNADHGDVVQAELDQRRACHAGLPLAAVDQHEIRYLAAVSRHALVAPREHLAHRCVIVTRCDAADVVAPVLPALHYVVVVHHAGRHGSLPHGMAHVEAFYALYRFGKAERLQPPFLRAPFTLAVRQGELGILARHLQPHAALALNRRNDVRGARAALGEGLFEHFAIDLRARQHQRRHGLLEIVLPEECAQHLCLDRALGVLREEAAVADVPPGADHHEVDARDAAFDRAGKHVGVDPLLALDVLPCLHPRQRSNLVAIQCRFLVAPPARGRFHLARQGPDDVVLAAIEEEFRVAHVLRVGFGADQSRARRRAATDLIKQAWPRPVFEHAVLAGAQPEHTLQQLNRLAYRMRVREWAEVAVVAIPGTPMEADARHAMTRDHEVRVGLVVAKQNVVARRMALDEIVLEQQRLGLGARYGRLDRGDLRKHHLDARTRDLLVEIRSDAFAQVARLAHIERLAARSEHAIDPGQVWKTGHK